MPKDTSYTSLQPDAEGYYPYSTDDDAVWGELFARQMAFLPGKVAPEYLDGVEKLGLGPAKTPQVKDIDAKLHALTGAGAEGVPAIIPPSQFYDLLSQRKFPVATFLRRREHMDYIEEPDLFHEVFGHCPMLTNDAYADFIEGFGKKAKELGKGYSWHMFRLFWFTVEFGMIQTKDGLRAYGAGIVSSPAEAAHAMSQDAKMQPFDLLTMFRTPYRIDIVQPVYFVIDSFDQLSAALDADFGRLIDDVKALGDLPPLFEAKEAS
ncbi:phenylalanine 4-monooxygenase [Yoonia sp. BS5-3]|uniref:Phenylalanine-4-hydroxylase n=1 Tax=Yoonia phaeophyticola TaxID=3137369 RepID=A0ABZ2V5B9_9RHOB